MMAELIRVLAAHGDAVRIDWGGLDETLTGNELTADTLLSAALLLIIGIGVSFLIGRWRRRLLGTLDDQSGQLIGLILRLVQVLALAVFVGWALTTLGSDIGWLTVMVVVALLIAVLAARPVFEGIGASAALATRRAFSVGDEIAIDDATGEVIEITNRSTVIKLRDGRRVHIPNVEMLNKTVTVYTVDGERRSAVDVTIAFGNDIDHVEQLIRETLNAVDSINRVGSIRARGLTIGVELSIRFWHPSGLQQGNDALNDAVRAIKRVLEREAIDIAAPEVAIVHTRAPLHTSEPEQDSTA
jgi:small-conductance mechanosensitive channel